MGTVTYLPRVNLVDIPEWLAKGQWRTVQLSDAPSVHGRVCDRNDAGLLIHVVAQGGDLGDEDTPEQEDPPQIVFFPWSVIRCVGECELAIGDREG